MKFRRTKNWAIFGPPSIGKLYAVINGLIYTIYVDARSMHSWQVVQSSIAVVYCMQIKYRICLNIQNVL